jgi:erythromycin esterase-like protein
VLLGELPTHGEAHTFDAKSKIADRLIAQCGFTAILFEAPIYDFIGFERAAATRTATPEQLENAIGRFWDRNLVWYLERLPANSRVVIWTATVHAARQRGALSEVPLGARVVERWGDRVGTVGFTAYAGYTSRAGRPARPIPDASPESLEATATSESAWALLDSDKLRAIGRVSSRLLGKFVSETWSDYFDAVVVIRQEVAPTFDPWK